jgi:hypothetical protein
VTGLLWKSLRWRKFRPERARLDSHLRVLCLPLAPFLDIRCLTNFAWRVSRDGD